MAITSTGGNTNIALGNALPGFQSFFDAGVVSNTLDFMYLIEDGNDFEYGYGRIGSGSTFNRNNPVESTNSGNKILLSGNATISTVGTARSIIQATKGIFVSGASPYYPKLDTGNVFESNSISSSVSITFSGFANPPPSGVAYCFQLILYASAAITITWDSSVRWDRDLTPPAPAVNSYSSYWFFTFDGGTNWVGSLNGEQMI